MCAACKEPLTLLVNTLVDRLSDGFQSISRWRGTFPLSPPPGWGHWQGWTWSLGHSCVLILVSVSLNVTFGKPAWWKEQRPGLRGPWVESHHDSSRPAGLIAGSLGSWFSDSRAWVSTISGEDTFLRMIPTQQSKSVVESGQLLPHTTRMVPQYHFSVKSTWSMNKGSCYGNNITNLL